MQKGHHCNQIQTETGVLMAFLFRNVITEGEKVKQSSLSRRRILLHLKGQYHEDFARASPH